MTPWTLTLEEVPDDTRIKFSSTDNENLFLILQISNTNIKEVLKQTAN